jgi:hypothetical protein
MLIFAYFTFIDMFQDGFSIPRYVVAIGHGVQFAVLILYALFFRYLDERNYAEHVNMVVLLMLGASSLAIEYLHFYPPHFFQI